MDLANSTYYQQRINQALKYINDHLGEPLNITQVARAANFSTFHFQRLYKSLQGETPFETILRLRLEQSIRLLKNHPDQKIAEIAQNCGFSSVENFSRQFKARFEFTPSAFRKDKTLQNSRIYQEENPEDFYTRIEKARSESSSDFNAKVVKLPAQKIAFIRAIFGADGSGLVEKYLELMAWAETQKLDRYAAGKRIGMSIDNPEVTPVGKYRYDFALVIDQDITPAGLIELGEIPGGEYVEVPVQGDIADVARAWDYLFKNWLPTSGYRPRNYPALEVFMQGPETIGWEYFNIICKIPIEKIEYDQE